MKGPQDSGAAPDNKKDATGAPARFKKLTKRQRKIVRTRLKHPDETQAEIGQRLGISQPHVARELAKPHVKAKFVDILDAAGVTDDRIAKKVNQLMDAKETKHFASFGKVLDTREVEALGTQLAATNLAAELRGHKQKKIDVTSNGDTVKALLLED